MGFESGTTVDNSISAVHGSIMQAHILTRLDGPTLASIACTSSDLYSLSTDENLWRIISIAIWPSINHPTIRQIISTFPSGHRSFFSDCFPLLDHQPSKHTPPLISLTEKLISVVDISYQDKVIHSMIEEHETFTQNFLTSPFQLELLDPEESIATDITLRVEQSNTWMKNLEENVNLSWIFIDPNRKKAINVSSRKPVSCKRLWLTDEAQLVFSTIMAGYRREESEFVECRIVVTCVRDEGGEVHVTGVSIQVEDIKGKVLSGRGSLVVLEGAMERGKRKRRNEEEVKRRYNDFLEKRSQRIESVMRKALSFKIISMALDILLLLLLLFFVSHLFFY